MGLRPLVPNTVHMGGLYFDGDPAIDSPRQHGAGAEGEGSHTSGHLFSWLSVVADCGRSGRLRRRTVTGSGRAYRTPSSRPSLKTGIRRSSMKLAASLLLALLFAAPRRAKNHQRNARRRRDAADVLSLRPRQARAETAPLIVTLHGSGRDGRILVEHWLGLAKKRDHPGRSGRH